MFSRIDKKIILYLKFILCIKIEIYLLYIFVHSDKNMSDSLCLHEKGIDIQLKYTVM